MQIKKVSPDCTPVVTEFSGLFVTLCVPSWKLLVRLSLSKKTTVKSAACWIFKASIELRRQLIECFVVVALCEEPFGRSQSRLKMGSGIFFAAR